MDYIKAFRLAAPSSHEDPRERCFAEIKRDSKGYFKDSDIAKILFDATDAPAGMFRANGTPQSTLFK